MPSGSRAGRWRPSRSDYPVLQPGTTAPPGAWAAERRARRAYFATLDALRTGTVHPQDEAKIGRLLEDLRSGTAAAAVRHFQRVLAYVHRLAGRSTLPTPPAPMRAVVITAPPPGPVRPAEFEARYRWALEWLDARRYVVSKGLRIEWRIRRVTPPAGLQLPGLHSDQGFASA